MLSEIKFGARAKPGDQVVAEFAGLGTVEAELT
jgi:hypothetical protein